MTDDNRGEGLAFLLAGHETTALPDWTWFYWPARGDPGAGCERPTVEFRAGLTGQVIDESCMYPPIWACRSCSRADEIDGFRFPRFDGCCARDAPSPASGTSTGSTPSTSRRRCAGTPTYCFTFWADRKSSAMNLRCWKCAHRRDGDAAFDLELLPSRRSVDGDADDPAAYTRPHASGRRIKEPRTVKRAKASRGIRLLRCALWTRELHTGAFVIAS